jgi:hypothetical protein
MVKVSELKLKIEKEFQLYDKKIRELKNKDNGDLADQIDNDKLNYCQGRYDGLNWGCN